MRVSNKFATPSSLSRIRITRAILKLLEVLETAAY